MNKKIEKNNVIKEEMNSFKYQEYYFKYMYLNIQLYLIVIYYKLSVKKYNPDKFIII